MIGAHNAGSSTRAASDRFPPPGGPSCHSTSSTLPWQEQNYVLFPCTESYSKSGEGLIERKRADFVYSVRRPSFQSAIHTPTHSLPGSSLSLEARRRKSRPLLMTLSRARVGGGVSAVALILTACRRRVSLPLNFCSQPKRERTSQPPIYFVQKINNSFFFFIFNVSL